MSISFYNLFDFTIYYEWVWLTRLTFTHLTLLLYVYWLTDSIIFSLVVLFSFFFCNAMSLLVLYVLDKIRCRLLSVSWLYQVVYVTVYITYCYKLLNFQSNSRGFTSIMQNHPRYSSLTRVCSLSLQLILTIKLII